MKPIPVIGHSHAAAPGSSTRTPRRRRPRQCTFGGVSESDRCRTVPAVPARAIEEKVSTSTSSQHDAYDAAPIGTMSANAAFIASARGRV